MRVMPFAIVAIAASVASFYPQPDALAQRVSGCRAKLIAQDRYAQINVRSEPGVEYSSPSYGLVGDTVGILRGNVDGFAIARDRQGNRWVKVEFVKSRARGWIRRDFISNFNC
jgi:hypothetical protein